MKKITLPVKYKDLMELWIEDLRENPDLQGTEFLYSKDTGKYCCLGRLCVVAHHNEEYFEGEVAIPTAYSRIPSYFKGQSEIYGVLTTMNDGVKSKERQYFLEDWGIKAELGQRFTFPEIADFLEKTIEYHE